MSEFTIALGYGDGDEGDTRDARAYNSPIAYTALSLQELSAHEERYNKLLQIREKVRSSTETSLGLCPNTLLIDFTTVSQKIELGAHRAHADNCLHYFVDGKATCADTSREHPYPNRVAASILYLDSGNFVDGEFYFANGNGEVDQTISLQGVKMIYFTSGDENLHGALPVQRKDSNRDTRRLALAMWYVFDKELEEYVPPFQQSNYEQHVSLSSNANLNAKPRKVYDVNDPAAPKELFTLPIPNDIDISALLQAIGSHLVKDNSNGSSWEVNIYEKDTLHVLFKDNSAMFSIDFGVALDPNEYADTNEYNAQSSIVVERHTDGRKQASLQYMLQESIMLHSLLDAVLTIEINDEKEKAFFSGQVEKARNALPARRA